MQYDHIPSARPRWPSFAYERSIARCFESIAAQNTVFSMKQ
jgi:hypothetical protein